MQRAAMKNDWRFIKRYGHLYYDYFAFRYDNLPLCYIYIDASIPYTGVIKMNTIFYILSNFVRSKFIPET